MAFGGGQRWVVKRRADMEPQCATGPATSFLQWPGTETAPVSSQPLAEIVPPIAALRGAGRTFDDVVALTGVDLAIARGSIVGVIGPSGAGKTTAIRLLTGGLRPTSGDGWVLGEDPPGSPPETRARIGFMPQHVSLYDDLTVAENLDFVASLFGLFLFRGAAPDPGDARLAGARDARKRRAAALSGGMRRRLQLGVRARPRPEPGVPRRADRRHRPARPPEHLDRAATSARCRPDAPRHHPVRPEAEECDEVALIADGRLVAFATPEALRRARSAGSCSRSRRPTRSTSTASTRPRGRGRPPVGPRRLHGRSAGRRDGDARGRSRPSRPRALRSTSIHESRPSFDEVFARLVGRSGPGPNEDPQGAQRVLAVTGKEMVEILRRPARSSASWPDRS